MLLVGAFMPRLRRATNVGTGAGILAGAIAGFGVAGTAPWPVVALTAGIAAALLGTVVAIALLPATIRRAHESFSWLGHRDVARFKVATGERTPVNPAETNRFLREHPAGSVPAWIRAELLITLGLVAEARAELAAAGPPPTDVDRLEIVALGAYGDLVETGELGEAAFAEALRPYGPGSPLALEAAVIGALTRTRLRLARGQGAPLEPLLEVRPRLGIDATRIVLRDTWLPYAASLFGFGLAVGILLVVIGIAR